MYKESLDINENVTWLFYCFNFCSHHGNKFTIDHEWSRTGPESRQRLGVADSRLGPFNSHIYIRARLCLHWFFLRGTSLRIRTKRGRYCVDRVDTSRGDVVFRLELSLVFIPKYGSVRYLTFIFQNSHWFELSWVSKGIAFLLFVLITITLKLFLQHVKVPRYRSTGYFTRMTDWRNQRAAPLYQRVGAV